MSRYGICLHADALEYLAVSLLYGIVCGAIGFLLCHAISQAHRNHHPKGHA